MKTVGSLVYSLVFSALLIAQDLGPHDINGQGCFSCHTTTDVDPVDVLATYLWRDYLSPTYFLNTTYPTEGDETLEGGSLPGEQGPSLHSAMCLVCHNGIIAQPGSMPDSPLTHDHPVNIPYPLGASGYWPGVVTISGVNFAPSHFDTVYGRPLRFYVSEGVAYIECSTCHDPHHYSAAPVTINGQTYTKPTAHFVRGWYDYRNPYSNSVSQFCRACHYEMSNEADGINAPTY